MVGHKHWLAGLLLCVLLAAGTPASAREDDARICKLGVFPFMSWQRLENIFAPLAARLGAVEECDSFQFRSARTFESFMKKLGNREFEIAYVQPFDYVRLAVPRGYVPLASRRTQLIATLVTHPQSNIESMEDLRGKTLALPPAVAAISYLTKAALQDAGLEPGRDVRIVHAKNHGSCLQRVLIGKADVCASVVTVIKLFETKNQLKMKWVAQSPPIPQTLFVARDDLSQASRDTLQQRFIDMRLHEAGARFFQADEHGRAFRVIEDREYDKVRAYWRRFSPESATD